MILYVSDLDGTLLSSDSELSIETLNIVKDCMIKGISFTIATGRSLFYTQKYIDELGLNIPVVLTNGAYVYDPVTKKYLLRNHIEKKVTELILDLMEDKKITPFIHIDDEDGTEKLYHKKFNKDCMIKVYDRQIKNNDNRQVLIEDYNFDSNTRFVSLNVIDKEEVLRPIYNKIVENFDVVTYLSEDHHYTGHFWLEVFSSNTSKGKALEFLKKHLNMSKIISFGDGYNDISMFEISDESYAVSNACDFVKSKASAIIGTNIENSVARHILGKL